MALQLVMTGAIGVGANALLNQDFEYGLDIGTAKIFGVSVASEVGSHYVTDTFFHQNDEGMHAGSMVM